MEAVYQVVLHHLLEVHNIQLLLGYFAAMLVNGDTLIGMDLALMNAHIL